MAMAVAPAIGPTLGGVQTDLNGWRSIFLTLTIIGCLAIVLTTFGLHNFGQADTSAHADFFSVGLSIIGFGGLMFGFTNIQAYPFSAPVVWLPMAHRPGRHHLVRAPPVPHREDVQGRQEQPSRPA